MNRQMKRIVDSLLSAPSAPEPEPEVPEAEEAEYVERSKEAVWVAVLTDPDDATYGGIDDPAMGDTLVLRGETTAPYSFRNEIKDRTTNSWALLYDRRRPQAVGPGGTGKLGQNA